MCVLCTHRRWVNGQIDQQTVTTDDLIYFSLGCILHLSLTMSFLNIVAVQLNRSTQLSRRSTRRVKPATYQYYVEISGHARVVVLSLPPSDYVVPPTRLSTVASRAFPVAAPQVRNALPEDVTSASSFRVFQSRLKTFLFQRSFSV